MGPEVWSILEYSYVLSLHTSTPVNSHTAAKVPVPGLYQVLYGLLG